jgi:hypothetical protein
MMNVIYSRNQHQFFSLIQAQGKLQESNIKSINKETQDSE